MDFAYYVIILLGLVGVVLESVMFFRIRKNGLRIFKYYTLLSNFLFLITSFIVVICGLFGLGFPLWLQGLYFATTLGLTLTMIVYWAIIHPRERNKKDTVSQASGISGVSNFMSNLIWHTICPIFALVCLLLLPRGEMGVEWIFIVMVPTVIYFIIYATLTLTRSWKEPYGFLIERQKLSRKGFLLCFGVVILALIIDFGLYQIVGILS